MRLVAFALAAAIILSGCASAAPQGGTPAPQLAGTQWRFVALHGEKIPEDIQATLRFDDKGRASGNGGCNHYGGTYLAGNDDALHFGEMISTRMACLQPAGAMETERGVLDALSHTAHARLQDGGMTLLDVAGTELATLQAQP
ncbi:MAG: META domain-containing protein [Proteobacteria bacterium]|nr:META domain-containing protein [Pseudomonadota bacterium]